MKTVFASLFTLLLASQANASSVIFNCNDGHGYIQTSTSVWIDQASGKLMADISVHDIENPGDYNVTLRAIDLVKNSDGSQVVSSRVKGRYLLVVSPDGKTAHLTATNISTVELSCK